MASQRWWKAGAVSGWAAVVLLVLAGAGAQPAGELRLKRLVIEDEKGRDRITLSVSEGSARLMVKNTDGGFPFILWCEDGGAPGLSMTNPGGLGGLMAGFARNGDGWVSMTDRKGKAIYTSAP